MSTEAKAVQLRGLLTTETEGHRQSHHVVGGVQLRELVNVIALTATEAALIRSLGGMPPIPPGTKITLVEEGQPAQTWTASTVAELSKALNALFELGKARQLDGDPSHSPKSATDPESCWFDPDTIYGRHDN